MGRRPERTSSKAPRQAQTASGQFFGRNKTPAIVAAAIDQTSAVLTERSRTCVPTPLFQANIPNLFPVALALRTIHFQNNRVIAALAVLVNRILLGGRSAIAERPFPRCSLSRGLILERHQPPVHVHHPERPVGLILPELRFERHQTKGH